MKCFLSRTSVVIGLCCWLLANPVFGQETNRQDFERWCSVLQGRWIGDVTYITDWPGFGKKGEKVTAYFQARPSLDGNGMITSFLGGKGSERGMFYYDAAAKRTRGTFVSSGGTLIQLTNWPDGDRWKEVFHVTLPDGTKGRIDGLLVLSENGKTLTIRRNGQIGDDMIKDETDVWRRVNPVSHERKAPSATSRGTRKSETPDVAGQASTREDFTLYCAQNQGRWICDVTWVTDWPGAGKKGDKVTGYWRGTVAEDGHVMVTNFVGGAGSDSGLIYYDAAAKRIRATVVSSGGTVFKATIWRDGTNWKETVDVTLADGTKGKFTRMFVYSDGGKTLTVHIDGKLGNEVIKDQQDIARRLSGDK